MATVRFQSGTTDGNTPQATSNVKGNPISGSSAENTTATAADRGRGTDPDGASLAKPGANPKGSGMGGEEEQANYLNDPKKPDHEKRKNVEKEGQKPLDPADK